MNHVDILPMKGLFKQVFVAFLTLIAVGAVLACTLAFMPAVDNMASNHDGLVFHTSYVQSLTSAITNTTPLILMVLLFFVAVLVALPLSHKSDIALLLIRARNYLKRKSRDFSYIPLSKITHWLSLFELSPNYIKPA